MITIYVCQSVSLSVSLSVCIYICMYLCMYKYMRVCTSLKANVATDEGKEQNEM